MKEKYEINDNFIGQFDNFFPEEMIQNYLNHFDYCEKNNLVYGREDESTKKDLSVGTMITQFTERSVPYNQQQFVYIFYNSIWPLYEKKFPMFKHVDRHTIYEIKIQKTKPSEGYHVWHSEAVTKKDSKRIFVFSLYLNDVKEGGETEFLYQRCRVKPIKNRFVLWPAHITHTHRGNPPLSNDKYILTGWIEYE
jgi:hypothetical protein